MVAKAVAPVLSVTQNLELHKKSSNNDNQLVKVSYFWNQMSAPTFKASERCENLDFSRYGQKIIF